MRSTTSILDVLRNPRFLRFYLAQAVSQLGDAILWMALALVAVQLEGATRTNSPTTPTTAGTRAEEAGLPAGRAYSTSWPRLGLATKRAVASVTDSNSTITTLLAPARVAGPGT